MIEQRVKVTMEGCDGATKVFIASDDAVLYRRDEVTESRPAGRWYEPWHKKIVTTHTLTWETVSYE